MPAFRRVSREEVTDREPAVSPALLQLRQYQGFIKKLASGETGRLRPDLGETPAAVRRRLGAAAKAMGLQLTMKRIGDQTYFWR